MKDCTDYIRYKKSHKDSNSFNKSWYFKVMKDMNYFSKVTENSRRAEIRFPRAYMCPPAPDESGAVGHRPAETPMWTHVSTLTEEIGRAHV